MCLAKNYKKENFIREKKVKELRKKLKNEYMTKSVENLLYSLGKKKKFVSSTEGISTFEHINDYKKILVDLKFCKV